MKIQNETTEDAPKPDDSLSPIIEKLPGTDLETFDFSVGKILLTAIVAFLTLLAVLCCIPG